MSAVRPRMQNMVAAARGLGGEMGEVSSRAVNHFFGSSNARILPSQKSVHFLSMHRKCVSVVSASAFLWIIFPILRLLPPRQKKIQWADYSCNLVMTLTVDDSSETFSYWMGNVRMCKPKYGIRFYLQLTYHAQCHVSAAFHTSSEKPNSTNKNQITTTSHNSF